MSLSNDNPTNRPRFQDVRMRGFRDRADVADVLAVLEQRLHTLASETVPLAELAGRVLASDVTAATDVPSFDRAAMDGYALIGSETFGAGSYNVLEFRLLGEAFPGRPFVGRVGPGEAVRIMTGAPLPAGADAVLQAEAAEEKAGRVTVSEPVPPGRHVGRRGEDVSAGTVVLSRGRVLRPQDVGVLASIGVAEAGVVRHPTVDLLISGDELLPPGSKPEGYRIVDSNSVMLAALVRRQGGVVRTIRMVADQRAGAQTALAETSADLVLISGGSSVGQEDHAPGVLAELGELCIHGVALRPASPTGLGFVQGRPVFLLPGNPVSCLCAFDLFAGAALRCLGGRSMELPYPRCALPLARKLSSMVGRVDYVRVRIHEGQVEPLATSGASILSSTTRADGFVLVPGDSEGQAAGENVTVYLYDDVFSWNNRSSST